MGEAATREQLVRWSMSDDAMLSSAASEALRLLRENEDLRRLARVVKATGASGRPDESHEGRT